MTPKAKLAVLQMYALMALAAEKQARSERRDQGNRSRVTQGQHLVPVAALIRDELVETCGFDPRFVFIEGDGLTLPGWARPTKDWDICAYHAGSLAVAIELKSINSSFGNNANNRTEEALGVACDARMAYEEGLLGTGVTPPVLGYVLVVKEDRRSMTPSTAPKSPRFFALDPAFSKVSYIDRFRLLCERLKAKSFYQAVWFVVANPETGEVFEPSPSLSYENFLEVLSGVLRARKA